MPPEPETRNMLLPKVKRDLVNVVLRPLLSWPPLPENEQVEGYSIMLGVPWHLRELLPTNLTFLAHTNLTNCKAIHVVFDRRHRPEHDQTAAEAQARFPGLPLAFHHLPPMAGAVAEALDVVNIYHAMISVVALQHASTRWAILHDFDLYPRTEDYFESVWQEMRRDDLRFCGIERTFFDQLTADDNVLGTWCLGMDAAWLRNKRKPIDVFPRVSRLRGRYLTLDPFSWLQLQTPQRRLAGSVTERDCSHVRNLCDTYLRYVNGRPTRLAWKLHSMWYLRALAHGTTSHLIELAERMEQAPDRQLEYEGRTNDFSQVDPTCANVLDTQVTELEVFLFRGVRPEVQRYIDATRIFMERP